jgi:flavin reductase (DIM6/NTAB) family NADH-FMN oxidoreductase RutF
MRKLPLAKVFHWLEPGPVVLVTTAYKGCANVMTMSWHMMLDFDPPKIACSIGPWDYSFDLLRKTKECVIAVPGADLMAKAVSIGNCSGGEIDKFSAFGLTAKPAKEVAAPLVRECLANFECRVVDTSLVKKYNVFVVEVLAAWVSPERKERRLFHANGDGTFAIAGRTVDLRKKMTKWQDIL